MECFQDQTGATPVNTVTAVGCPFTVTITTGTPLPVLTITLDQSIANVQVGQIYNITIISNGITQVIPLQFLFAEGYVSTNWFNVGQGDLVAGQAFTFREVLFGNKYRTTDLNIRFKMLFEYCSLLYFRISDLASKFETKRRIKDIVDCGLLAGVTPKNCTAVVTRDVDGDITILNLTYDPGDQAYTAAYYTYVQLPVIIDFSANPAPYNMAAVTNQKKFLNQVDIWRVTANGTNSYKICTVVVTRTPITVQSDTGSAITIPLVSGWTVTE
jgi:hypothetical protein